MTEKVLSVGRTRSATYTRPSDTNAYAAGDVIADSTSAPTILTFAGATTGKASPSIIQHALIVTSASVATKPDLELWLFDTTIVMDNDNAVFTPTDAELLTLIGVITFAVADFKVGDATVGAGGNAICEAKSLGVPFNSTTSSNDLFGVLVVRNAYVPVSGEIFTVRLKFLD